MAEHPFAQYVRILGKGKKGSRSLTQDEAYDAMSMILSGQVRPEQLGAFLMLLRVKEEAPEELAGFIRAARVIAAAPSHIQVDIDWSSYAGKKRQLPWFLLVALVLAGEGIRVFMHGSRGHTEGRLYTEDMLSLFKLPACQRWDEVDKALQTDHFAFMAIDQMVPQLGEIIQLRPILGLRSPVHTLCRLINPLGASCTVDGVFHPAYAPMHQRTSQLLAVANGLTIRGDGGEAEIKPDSDCEVRWVRNGELEDEQWPRLYPQRLVKEESLAPQQLLDVWRGAEHSYGEGAVLSTLATVLKLMGRADNAEQAIEQARILWQQRDKQRFD